MRVIAMVCPFQGELECEVCNILIMRCSRNNKFRDSHDGSKGSVRSRGGRADAHAVLKRIGPFSLKLLGKRYLGTIIVNDNDLRNQSSSYSVGAAQCELFAISEVVFI